MKIEDLELEVKKLALAPGEIIIIKPSQAINRVNSKIIFDHLKELFPNNIIFIESGVELEIKPQWTIELPEKEGYYWLWNHIKEEVEIVLILESEDGMMVRYLEYESWREPLQFLPPARCDYWWLRVEAPAPPEGE